MTRIVESITVEIQCEARDVAPGPRSRGPLLVRCSAKAKATIVSTVETSDLVLVPIGWNATTLNKRLTIRCPDHQEE